MKKWKKGAAPPEPRRRQGRVAAAAARPDLGAPIAEPAEPKVFPGFPIVGLGASAGGLQALEEFFSNMPSDSGMAFVLVTHLHPGQPSMLHELVGRKTSMPVNELKKSTVVEQNHIYTITPGRNLAILNGTLQPMAPDKTAPLQLPIDYFFRSLAQDQKDRAIGIILSGTGSDGTLGLKEIKGALGMVMVQREESASYPGMPQSAIATGLVDYVLAPAEMPSKLVAYVKDAYGTPPRVLRARDEAAPHPDALQQVFVLLRARTRHDFSQYKGSTINRRIERRMNVHHLDSLKRYVRFLQENPGEIDLLFKELLIGVTSFFRDPDAFEGLAAALGALLTRKADNYGVRIWVPGCSSGEEAYSIAILLREFMEQTRKPLAVQIFATDLDSDAIDVARTGIYPLGIASDVTPRRLKRYFVRDEEAFRVTKELREMVVFAPQNLIEDPPFTKVDLLSCRNLLIYLDGALQRRLLPIFHYALRPEGVLFLGSSESIGSFNYLFETLDKKWKVFQRKEVAAGTYMAEFPAGIRGTPPLDTRLPAAVGRPGELTVLQGADKLIMRELLPPTVIIRERGDIVHIHGRTGLFLELSPGPQPVANIFNMARDGLQLEIASVVRQAAVSEGEIVRRDVRFKPNGAELVVDIRARRLHDPEPFRGLIIISFDGLRPLLPPREKGGKAQIRPRLDRVGELERELQYTKDSHQKTIEELETANEELKSTNEELQSTNEELQSANEELETSKEEMQSLNEELQTVNAELSGKVEELSRANDDMKNLLNATDIATIFLDNDLNITRYTEQAKRIMRLIPSDVGRPIADLVPRLRYAGLAEDARQVLSTLIYKEVEVQGEEGGWYFMRILPYRTTDNVIDGLVMTFIDVTKIKVLQENQQRLMHALKSSPTTVFGQDRDLRYTWIASGAFGRTPEAIVGKKDEDLFDPDSARRLGELKRRAMEGDGGSRHTTKLTFDRETRLYDLYLESMKDDAGNVIGVTGVHTDVTSVVQKQ
jgi:two-component system CheB/CheR fusion protein